MQPNAIQVTLAVVEQARAGRFEEICDQFVPALRPLATADALQAAWAAAIERLGPITSVGTPLGESVRGVDVVKVPLRYARGALTLVVGLTPAAELTSLQLAPPEAMEAPAPWEPPPYADPALFDEQELVLGPDGLAVPATVSLPHQAGSRSAVVLLAGSGPLDRDETIGPNKPFKDLAWGLASSGVVVLRFDKVTYAHGAEPRVKADFTPTDEYLPQARAAIELLLHHPAVDPRRVIVAGHSLGGTVAPRVAAAEPRVAGLIILAGGAEPLHWVIVRQARYLAALDPTTAAAAEPGLAALTRQAERVDSPDLSPDTPAAELPLGAPAPYWLALRGYDPPAEAAALAKPVLVLQGGRDYQATVADDLARWQAALGARPHVTLRVFPADNHFFFPGAGVSTPQEALQAGQHMDPAVIAAIADWVPSVPGRTVPRQ